VEPAAPRPRRPAPLVALLPVVEPAGVKHGHPPGQGRPVALAGVDQPQGGAGAALFVGAGVARAGAARVGPEPQVPVRVVGRLQVDVGAHGVSAVVPAGRRHHQIRNRPLVEGAQATHSVSSSGFHSSDFAFPIKADVSFL